MNLEQVLEYFKSKASVKNAKSLTKYGIAADQSFGIRMPVIRELAKKIGKNQKLAEQLWNEGHHECKLLAGMCAEPKNFSLSMADAWVQDIYSWDVCDQLCINLLVKTDYAWSLPARWVIDDREFVRRVGLVMIVVLRIHKKKVADEEYEQFFPMLKEYATDERNFVKKAVNWAIRDLGKRSAIHHPIMISLCHDLLELDSKAASWIANDAIRELESEKVKARLVLI